MAKYSQTITVQCPRCGSGKVVKRGYHEGKQTFSCKTCARRFFESGETLDNRAQQVGAAVSMYYDGLSYKRIAENIAATFDRPEPSKRTIYQWVRNYTDKAIVAMREYPAHTGDEWVADEMVLSVGGKEYWNWNVMDTKTRYVLASHLSESRNRIQAAAVMEKALHKAARPPKIIKTDRLSSYDDGIDMVFGGEVEHVKSDGIHAEINNNMSERLQGTFRERAKVMRGLQSRESGQKFLDGWVINYTGITHIKLPGSKQRTILDESHRSISHGCRQPSNQAHKTISRRGELAAPGSGGGFHHVCTPFKLLRARTSPLVASLHL